MIKKVSFRRGDELVSLLLQGGKDKGGALSNELLNEVFRGYPIDKLRLLLTSNNDHAVAAGVWIAAELSDKAKPLLSDIIPLIHHPSHHVRFFIPDYLLLCAEPEDAQAINEGLDLLDDTHFGVREQTMKFLSVVPKDTLEAVLHVVEAAQKPSLLLRVEGLNLLLHLSNSHEGEKILNNLVNSNATLRRYAVVGAVRLAKYNRVPLHRAMKSKYPEVKHFAVSMAQILQNS